MSKIIQIKCKLCRTNETHIECNKCYNNVCVSCFNGMEANYCNKCNNIINDSSKFNTKSQQILKSFVENRHKLYKEQRVCRHSYRVTRNKDCYISNVIDLYITKHMSELDKNIDIVIDAHIKNSNIFTKRNIYLILENKFYLTKYLICYMNEDESNKFKKYLNYQYNNEIDNIWLNMRIINYLHGLHKYICRYNSFNILEREIEKSLI